MSLHKQNSWPLLSYSEGKETYTTIHLWSQIIGKIKMVNLPWINHSWHVALQVTPVGLATGPIPYGDNHFQITLNFLTHSIDVISSNGHERSVSLFNLSVAACYREVSACLTRFGIDVKINTMPNEIADAIPFPDDEVHNTYQPAVASALHQALLQSNAVFTTFRSSFIGKCSPVHFFWGSFDLAVSRFSGRTAPPHPGGVPNLPDWVAREAYSHEVCSCGFWPGNDMMPFAAFYSYIYPEPQGYAQYAVKPSGAYFHPDLKEFVLPYSEVQQADDPTSAVLDFLQSTYDAAANAAKWHRAALEK